MIWKSKFSCKHSTIICFKYKLHGGANLLCLLHIEAEKTVWMFIRWVPEMKRWMKCSRWLLLVVFEGCSSTTRQNQNSKGATVHEGHAGISVIKGINRGYIWLPSLDRDIHQCVQSCHNCQMNHSMPSAMVLKMWELPDRPWSLLHIDFAGLFLGKMLLIVVDEHKWLMWKS